MKIKNYLLVVLASIFFCNCSHVSEKNNVKVSYELTRQQADGMVSLRLANAGYYNDTKNPSYNTAEWNVVISSPGAFEVWLSSATRDTSNLNYPNSVKVNLPDTQCFVVRQIHMLKDIGSNGSARGKHDVVVAWLERFDDEVAKEVAIGDPTRNVKLHS